MIIMRKGCERMATSNTNNTNKKEQGNRVSSSYQTDTLRSRSAKKKKKNMSDLWIKVLLVIGAAAIIALLSKL